MASANSTDKLIIFKGDDTGGTFGRRLAFTIEAGEGVDLSGCRAEWIFDGIVKTFAAPLIPGEVREVFYSHNETRCMALGVRYGTFRIIDAAGKVRTLTNTKPVEVTNDAARCYPGASDASFVVHGIGDMKHSEFADLDEKEGMTLKEVGSMMNTLIRKLKGTISAFASILAFGAFADGAITPQTDFGDISPTAKIGAVISDAGAVMTESDPTVPAWAKQANPPDGMTDNALVLTNGEVKTASGSKTINASEVNALPDDEKRLVENHNFSNAVVSVSPTVVLPEKWALSNVTNANGDAVNSADVGALSKDGGIITGYLTIGIDYIEDDESLSAEKGIRANGGFARYSDSWYGPKLKWMGEYFEDSMSGENGRIYIPYTDAPWIDAIKEGSVKGLALYSDLDGFIKSESDPVFSAWLDGSFSNAVLAVGLNIDTNSVAVLNEIASTFGGFPIEGTATTVGGLLAALAAAIAWMKKNKVGSFASVGGATATVENGVAELDDFFTNSNSLLTGTIDARLPYPLYTVPSTGILKDRAINTTSLASVTVSDNFTDLLVRASVASSLAVTMPEAIATKYGDTFPGEAGEYLITITKTGAAEAYVRTIKLEEVA